VKPKALIFDFDGLILDTESAQYKAWGETYAEYGLPLPLERWVACVGTDWDAFNPYKDLEERTKALGRPFDRAALKLRKDARAVELIGHLQPLPGVVELIRAAKADGCKLGVASSSSRSWVQGHLERLGLWSLFDAVRTSEDVAKVKPAPDLYLSCLQALGVPVSEAIVLEDSPNGVKAAKAAGIYTIACPNPVTRGLDFSHADRVVEALGPGLLGLDISRDKK
jgi:HAD superfamily hydrolase (TIGR01509 family)